MRRSFPTSFIHSRSLFGVAVAGLLAACTATGGNNGFTGSGSGGNGAGHGAGGDLIITTGTSSGTSTDEAILTSTPPCNVTDPNADADGDGFTIAQGDCNDCTRQMNPGAYDYPGNGVDEDCNGAPDDDAIPCDGPLNVASNDAADGAKAIGICKLQQGASWGLVSARYATADNQPLGNYDPQGIGHGILTGFGPNVHPQEGHRVLALSSGTARQPTDPGYDSVSGHDKFYGPTEGTFAPPGFPKESPSCPGTMTGPAYDSAALELTLRVPTNARSLAFNLDFYTYEFPEYICDEYNDFFVALMSPAPMGVTDGNISFDSQGNLVSVNAGFLQVCKPQVAGGKNFACPLGTSQLQGTGFELDPDGFPIDNSAATGWLETSAPVVPGSTIKLRFAIWDSGDPYLDSTVLIDNFTWDAKGGEAVTNPIIPK